MKELFTGCARLNLSRVVGLFGFIYKVCYFLFNGVVYLLVDGEPSSLRLPTLPFQLTELLRNTAEPGCRLPCTGCATAERGMLVKDRTEMVIVVTDRTDIYIYVSSLDNGLCFMFVSSTDIILLPVFCFVTCSCRYSD